MPHINEMSFSSSKWMSSADVRQGDLTLTIAAITQEKMRDGNLKWIVWFNEVEKGLPLNKRNTKAIARATGLENSDDWPGQQITLYLGQAEYQGDTVDSVCVVVPDAHNRSRGPVQRPGLSGRSQPPSPQYPQGHQYARQPAPATAMMRPSQPPYGGRQPAAGPPPSRSPQPRQAMPPDPYYSQAQADMAPEHHEYGDQDVPSQHQQDDDIPY